MTKEEAIKWIKEIQNGEYDRHMIINQIPCGRLARRFWDDSLFSLGMEYGAIMALMTAFKIKKDEL
jgi:hypothetical protein